jgi:hypothetical protein
MLNSGAALIDMIPKHKLSQTKRESELAGRGWAGKLCSEH